MHDYLCDFAWKCIFISVDVCGGWKGWVSFSLVFLKSVQQIKFDLILIDKVSIIFWVCARKSNTDEVFMSNVHVCIYAGAC